MQMAGRETYHPPFWPSPVQIITGAIQNECKLPWHTWQDYLVHLNLPLVCALRAAHIPDAESFCGAYLLNHWRWLRTSNDGLPQYKAPTERTGAFTFLEMIPHFQEQIDQAILTQFLPSNTLNHGTSVHAQVIISVLRHFLCSDPATRLAGEVCCEPCGDLFISALDNILGIVS